MTDTSSALQLLDFALQHYGHKKPHSYTRLNSMYSQALKFAIVHHFEFHKDDFIAIHKDYGFWYWGGKERHMIGEEFYYYACEKKNMGACLAFEKWKQRNPFILKTYGKYDNRITSQRLAIGSQFIWKGVRVKCTSFNEDGNKITACSYRKDDKYKVDKRYSISLVELKIHNKEECAKKEELEK